MGYCLNRLDEPVFMAVSKPLLTEFGIRNRLESCGLESCQESRKQAMLVTIPGCILVGWRLINGGVAALFAHVVMLENKNVNM